MADMDIKVALPGSNEPTSTTSMLSEYESEYQGFHTSLDDNSLDGLGISTSTGTLSQNQSEHRGIQDSPTTQSTTLGTPDISEKDAKTTVVSEHIELCTTPDPPSLDTTSATHWLSRALEECGDRWVLELLSCGMAVACLVAIIAILAVYQDKPLPNSPDAISINSWVSIFTAVMKAAVMLPVAEGISQMKWLWFRELRPLIHMEAFDSASRGPWGAALLLFSSFRGHHLASFGAFISILAMAIDPFSQQIIQYYNCFPVSSTAFANMPRTNNYTADGISTRPGNAELNEHMSTAIMLGTLDTAINATSLIPFTCSSGNCTFPTDGSGAAFQTLGMCHTCKEMNELIRPNSTFPGYWLENWTPEPAWGKGWDTWWDRPAYVGYVFPNSTTNTTWSMFWSRKTLAFSPDFDDLITFDALMLNVDPKTCDVAKSEFCPKHPWAVRCSIYPCIQTYNASIVNSVLTETLLSTTPLKKTQTSDLEITQSPNMTFSLATDSILRNGTWAQCRVSDAYSDTTPVAIGTNNTLVQDNPSPGSPLRYYEADCVWNLGYSIGLALNQYMSWMYDDNNVPSNHYLEAYQSNTMDTQGPQVLKMMYLNGTATLETVNQYVTGLTGSITAMMRQRGEGGPALWAVGDVLESRTCIGVKWAWISLPALLILLSVGFLAATAVCSVRAGMWTGAWRSSAVAPFLAGINSDGIDTVVGGAGRRSGLESVAEKVHVKVIAKEERLESF